MLDSSLPLSDVTVLDLSDAATVFGARLLAELGARVIRVGGPTMAMPPQPPAISRRAKPDPERTFAHLLYNAGTSVAMEFASPSGVGVVDLRSRSAATS